MTIGDRIRDQRKLLGMTMEDLSRKIGVRRATISRYESGSITIPTERIKELADALEVQPGYLAGWVDLKGQTTFFDDGMPLEGTFSYSETQETKSTKRMQLESLIRNATEDQLDLLINLVHAVVSQRKP